MKIGEIVFFWLFVCICSTYVVAWLYVQLSNENNRKEYWRNSSVVISLIWCIIGMITSFAFLFNYLSKL